MIADSPNHIDMCFHAFNPLMIVLDFDQKACENHPNDATSHLKDDFSCSSTSRTPSASVFSSLIYLDSAIWDKDIETFNF